MEKGKKEIYVVLGEKAASYYDGKTKVTSKNKPTKVNDRTRKFARAIKNGWLKEVPAPKGASKGSAQASA